MKVGDLVKRVHFSDALYEEDKELFIVLDITGPYPNRRDKEHEMTLKIWEVKDLPGQVSHVPMNIFEVI